MIPGRDPAPSQSAPRTRVCGCLSTSSPASGWGRLGRIAPLRVVYAGDDPGVEVDPPGDEREVAMAERRVGSRCGRSFPGDLRRAGRAPLILAGFLILLLGPACGRNRADRESIPQPLGGGSSFLTLLDEAMRRADPQGAVLVVLWTTDQEPPAALDRIAKDWNRYGLIPIGVCLDLVAPADPARSEVGSASREAAIARVRSWERSHKGGIRGMIFEGDAGVLARSLDLARSVPSVALLSAQGAVLWSREGFGGLDELEAMLNLHLGQPPLALAGWTTRGASAPAKGRPSARGPAEAAG